MPRHHRNLTGRRLRAALEPIVARAPAIAVALDFDGSLAPIVADPGAATALPEAIDAVRGLSGRVQEIAIVSGRPVEFLRAAVPVRGAVLLGQYGMEREGSDGSSVLDPRVREALGPIDITRIAREARAALPDVRVEEKGGVAVALHWREHPDAAGAAVRWAVPVAERTGLALAPGRMALELRPLVPVDKGTAVRDLVLGPPSAVRDRLQAPKALIVAGDDHGDIPAFRVAEELVADGTLAAALRIGVRSAEAPPELDEHSDLVVDGPHGLAQVLAALARALAG